MPANTSPIFILTPNCSTGVLSTANTGRDGTGTLVDVFTAGSNGSRLEWLRASATGTTTAGMLRFFYYDGTNNRFLFEVPVPAITPSATVGAYTTHMQFGDTYPLVLESGHILKMSTEKSETFHVVSIGGDY